MSRDKDYDEYCLKAGIENRNTSTVRLGDLEHMNFQELESMVLKHEQQIKDLAAHLLEIKQLITPMMEFKQDAVAKTDYERGFDDGFILRKEKDGKRQWVGLTEDEAFSCKGREYFETYKAIEAKLKEKNCG